ncbi:MAG TPA: YetF domain-containing protein [Pirellulales bacterium]|jgi:uncharacterized membrane protein YcaP (DUF421 family)
MSLEMWWPEISVLEKMFRPLVVYLFLLIGLRLAGKRELAQLNAMDLIVLLTLSNTVQNAIIGPDNSLTGGLIGATTLLGLNYVVVRFLFNHPKFDRLIEGRGAVLVQGGKMLRSNMAAELITRPELEAAAHKQGFARLSLVDKAVLEPSGSMTFVGKEPSVGEARQTELTSRLDQIAGQLAEIRASLAAGK